MLLAGCAAWESKLTNMGMATWAGLANLCRGGVGVADDCVHGDAAAFGVGRGGANDYVYGDPVAVRKKAMAR